MTEVEALRRLALSSPRACRALARGDVCANLSSSHRLRAALRASRLSPADIGRLIASLITSDAPPREPSENEIETVKMVAKHS